MPTFYLNCPNPKCGGYAEREETKNAFHVAEYEYDQEEQSCRDRHEHEDSVYMYRCQDLCCQTTFYSYLEGEPKEEYFGSSGEGDGEDYDSDCCEDDFPLSLEYPDEDLEDYRTTWE